MVLVRRRAICLRIPSPVAIATGAAMEQHVVLLLKAQSRMPIKERAWRGIWWAVLAGVWGK